MKVLFTDLDGTCVHYTDDPTADGPWGQVASQPDSAGLLPCTSPDGSRTTLLLRLPPSASGECKGVESGRGMGRVFV